MFDFEKSISKKVFKILKTHIKKSDVILDLGSGAGWIAHHIEQEIGSKVTCIDVNDMSATGKKPEIFDGKNIPYEDNNFTLVICLSVLHHTKHRAELLEEMRRVTKSRVIILEDISESIVDKILVNFHKLFSVVAYKSKFNEMRFNGNRKWQEVFENAGFKLEKVISVGRRDIAAYYPVAQKVYFLKKT